MQFIFIGNHLLIMYAFIFYSTNANTSTNKKEEKGIFDKGIDILEKGAESPYARVI